MTGDPLEAQSGIVGERGGEGPKFQRDSGRKEEVDEERIERADWESVRKRTDWNLQIIKWLVHQTRPCLRAKVSAVKLEVIGPEEKERELDVLRLEHVTYTPAPPGPKREGTDPSVHTLISDGGGRIVCLQQIGVRLYCCLCSRE